MAEEKGFFRDEGLDYEFDAHGFAAASVTTSSVKPADTAPVPARSGAFEDMEKGRSCDVFERTHRWMERWQLFDSPAGELRTGRSDLGGPSVADPRPSAR